MSLKGRVIKLESAVETRPGPSSVEILRARLDAIAARMGGDKRKRASEAELRELRQSLEALLRKHRKKQEKSNE